MDIINKSKEEIYMEAFWLGYNQALEDHTLNMEAQAKRPREKRAMIKKELRLVNKYPK